MATSEKTMERASSQAFDHEKCKNTHCEDVCSVRVGNEKAQGDYSGATAKVDPVEIRLVRKLDFRIMPILWAMYFLNYVSFYILFYKLTSLNTN